MSDYYERHATLYFNSTVHLDMSRLYEPFLKCLPTGASILDAGCGSGRDAKEFRARGYAVEAFDASAELAEMATAFSGLEVKRLRFQQMDYRDAFDGIWACASLLHVPSVELTEVLGRMRRALKTGGTAFISFKYGSAEGVFDDGRYFTCFTAESLRDFLMDCPGWEIGRTWVTGDVRADHPDQRWLNVLLTADGHP